MTIQGFLFHFCPSPHSVHSYCFVWELSFAIAKLKGSFNFFLYLYIIYYFFLRTESKGDRHHTGLSTKTKILFLAWTIFDIPLFVFSVVFGNPLQYFIFLAGWGLINYECLRHGNSEVYWALKYFSVPFDVYISYALYSALIERESTAGSLDVAIAVLKMIADFCYLFPCSTTWFDRYIHGSQKHYAVVEIKFVLVLFFSTTVMISDAALIYYVLS